MYLSNRVDPHKTTPYKQFNKHLLLREIPLLRELYCPNLKTAEFITELANGSKYQGESVYIWGRNSVSFILDSLLNGCKPSKERISPFGANVFLLELTLLKERICSSHSKFFPVRVDPINS